MSASQGPSPTKRLKIGEHQLENDNVKGTAAAEHQPSCHPQLSFLDLPAEIRLQVYGHFVTIPAATTRTSKEQIDHRAEVILTRYSLQLLCRQISAEWSPLFYSTTTITVNGAVRYKELSRTQVHSAGLSPDLFESNFLLADQSLHILNAIKRIHYDATIQEGFYRRNTDYAGMQELSNIIATHHDVLTSLEEITLLSSGISQKTCQALRKGYSLKWCWLYSTAHRAGGHKGWRDAQKCLIANWTAIRRMHLQREGARQSFDQVALVFRKAGLPAIANADGWVEV